MEEKGRGNCQGVNSLGEKTWNHDRVLAGSNLFPNTLDFRTPTFCSKFPLDLFCPPPGTLYFSVIDLVFLRFFWELLFFLFSTMTFFSL